MTKPAKHADPAADPGHSLADFLRSRRDSLRPESLGLPAGQRRRAPGLRREEVAALCDISPTWYTWLEQGRTRGVSIQTLDALARGLQLTAAERAYLFTLAGRADPAAPAARDASASPGLMRQLQAQVRALRTPAYVLDRAWNALAWNPPAARLFADWLGLPAPRKDPAPDRNLLRYVFLHPEARRFIVDWPDRAQRLVAEYRADTAGQQDDPAQLALVRQLRAASADFDTAWRSQRVLTRDGGSRAFHHPTLGRQRYEQLTWRLAQQSELKLIVLVAADAAG